MEEFIFEKLDVWQKSRSLVSEIYRHLDKFPSTEKYALCDQIRRAAVSIGKNGADCYSKNGHAVTDLTRQS